jgi:hypothetical protein
VKQAVSPNLNTDIHPFLSVETKLSLDTCLLGESRQFNILLQNTGKIDLKIIDIGQSCSCVKLLGNKKYTILPGKSEKVAFEFKPDTKGDVYREIMIVSNAVKPTETIEITAFVK